MSLNLVETEAFIDGLWIEGDDTFEVLNPADGTVIAKVADLGAGETRWRSRPRIGPSRPGRPGRLRSAARSCAGGAT